MKWTYKALLLVLAISMTSVLWAASDPYTTDEAKRIGSQAASDAQKAATDSVKESVTGSDAVRDAEKSTTEKWKDTMTGESSKEADAMMGMSKSDVKQMTDQNIGHIARTLSMMTDDLSKAAKGDDADKLSDAADKLKSMSEKMTGSRVFGSGIDTDELKEVSKTINTCITNMSQNAATSDTSKQAMTAEMQQAGKNFKAHAALLAGNLANFAGYLNMLATSGAGEMKVSPSQADMFMRESLKLMSDAQALVARAGSQSGMIGAMDTNSTSESGMIGAMDANDANSVKDANSLSSGAWNKSSSASSTSPTASKSTMLGSSMDTAGANKVVRVLDDSSRLMKNMAGALTGEQATAMNDLGVIVGDISKLKTACMRQQGMSPSTNLGSSDIGAETESTGMSGRTGAGVGAGTGGVSGTRDYGRSGNTAGSSTGTGAEIGSRTYDTNDVNTTY